MTLFIVNDLLGLDDTPTEMAGKVVSERIGAETYYKISGFSGENQGTVDSSLIDDKGGIVGARNYGTVIKKAIINL